MISKTLAVGVQERIRMLIQDTGMCTKQWI